MTAAPPWLPRALREMAVRDPAAAGRLILQLLPAHGLVDSRDVSYDVVVDGVGCFAVTSQGGSVAIAERPEPRPVAEVDFRLSGSLAALGAALARGRLGRLFTAERVSVVPGWRRAETLRALAQAPLGLRALHGAGVRLDPLLAYRALVGSIEPQWTARERFTLLHEVEGSPGHRCCVHVDGERPVAVLSPSVRHTHVTVRVCCVADQFVPLLVGDLTHAEEARLVEGDAEVFARLQDWIARIEWWGAYGG